MALEPNEVRYEYQAVHGQSGEGGIQKPESTVSNNTLVKTVEWFRKVRPQPTLNHLNTQLGVHFEEVSEMVRELESTGINRETSELLIQAENALTELANHLKKNNDSVYIPDENRVDYLDAVLDQIITATGSGIFANMLVVEALEEVNNSNYSKFRDGEPIFDENGKVMKNKETYYKPNLKSFI